MIRRDYKTLQLTSDIFDKEIKRWEKEKKAYEEQYNKTKSVTSYEASKDIMRMIDEIKAHKEKTLAAIREYEDGY